MINLKQYRRAAVPLLAIQTAEKANNIIENIRKIDLDMK